MNFNFNTKYKARTPEDTISIVKNFFEGRGYTLTEVAFQTEAGTWTVHIELFDKGFYILQSIGKNRMHIAITLIQFSISTSQTK